MRPGAERKLLRPAPAHHRSPFSASAFGALGKQRSGAKAVDNSVKVGRLAFLRSLDRKRGSGVWTTQRIAGRVFHYVRGGWIDGSYRSHHEKTLTKVEAHEAKVQELEDGSQQNSAQLERLKGELDALRSKFAELERDQERLQRAVAESRQLIKTRLEQIEQRLGISAPDP